jgi:hypothetical protein
MRVFPAWMYRDPADVADRIETAEARAAERERLREIDREREFSTVRKKVSYGALTAVTVRLINRTRIRALVSRALKERT